ncbi:MAG: D-2-hydroxyacid dehydrogenase [Planctomycetota bacterium]|nr:MAG: D-2-hydroxyacid dehydrogenase [Planctomycetota bacterium]REJ90993.1 MAG: D-2-hydroxyacid dehydrogenase [Planctomycetota bacterium]REK25466.1 MAG: D-2-hydroxyacid dehydrogenase [Planctomycetota bacterium]REK40860.1 MAG: D-2-hydroxyacid dehydrogenase [Planctomycetota bacterium]
MRIVLCYPVEERHIRQIEAAARPLAADVEVVDAGQERIAEEILAADIYCGHAKVPMPWPQVVAAGRLRWIQSSAAGIDHCLVPEIASSEIPVTSASGVLADQVAEHAMALITAQLRSLPVFFRAQAAHEFIRRPTRDLTDSTVGIVGLGGVGRRLAQVLEPFRVRTLATDAYPIDKPACVDELWPADRLDDLLQVSDVVVLALPLNGQTRGLIDRTRLLKMKPDALLVNVARGAIIVERDLIEVLRSGHLLGAAVDVTENEPLAPDSPLWDFSNVIITPHVGGQSARRIDNMTNFFCENLARYHRGEPLLNMVDKQLGFPRR